MDPNQLSRWFCDTCGQVLRIAPSHRTLTDWLGTHRCPNLDCPSRRLNKGTGLATFIREDRMDAEGLSQRALALELRYAIDVAKRTGREPARNHVRALIEANTEGFRSSHVQHNLGEKRLRWLKEQQLVPA